MKEYSQKSGFSKFSFWSTIGVYIMFLVLILFWRWGEDTPNHLYLWKGGVLLSICVMLTVAALFYSPVRVIVTPEEIKIKKIIGKKHIPATAIETVEVYHRTMNFLRIFGSGGFYGFWGWFRNQELGKFFVYAGNLKQLVVVRLTSGQKYVISCNDSAEMVEVAKKLLER